MESSTPPPPPASETAAPPEAGYYLEGEFEEEEESLTARVEVHWGEASTDGEELEEELEGDGNVELGCNFFFNCTKC